MATYDSLLIGGHIELLGPGGSAGTTPGMGTPSADPNFPGVVFSLQPAYSLGEPQPTVDLLAPLLFDGERPWGRRASNRTIQLPVYVIAPVDAGDPAGNWSYLAAAVESLMYTCDADTFTIMWTRHQGADPQPLPLVFDCFRAQPAAVQWGGIDEELHSAIAVVTLNITALPYGRSDFATVVDFQSSLSGIAAPPSPVQLEAFNGPTVSSGSVVLDQWTQSAQSPSGSGGSAYWDPDTVTGWQVMFTGDGVHANCGANGAEVTGLAAGNQYGGQAWFMSPQGVPSGVQINIAWFNASNVFISSSSSPSVVLQPGVPVLVSSGLLTAPTGTTQGYVTYVFTGTPASTVQVFLAAGPYAVFPGSGFRPYLSDPGEMPAGAFGPAGGLPSTVTNIQPWASTLAGTVPSPNWQVMFTGDGATGTPYAYQTNFTTAVPGLSYPLDVWLMSPQGWAAGQVTIGWYLSGAFQSQTVINVDLLPGIPVHVTGQGTCPAGANQAEFAVKMTGTPAATVQFFLAGGAAIGNAVTSAAAIAGWAGADNASVTVLAPWANNPQFGNGLGLAATYANTCLNFGSGYNIIGEQAVTFWAGFGSSLYFPNWCRKGGLVSFAVTLTDNNGQTLAFSRVQKCYGSNNASAPRWNKIRATLPKSSTFNFANVAQLQVVATNYGSDLRYTRVYLSDVEAVPPPLPTASQPNSGAVYDLGQVQGSARSPISLQAQLGGTSTVVKPFTLPGAAQWTCPVGVTSVSVYAVGGGGAGSRAPGQPGGGGGGGGGSAANASVAVTPGTVYNLTVGAGGVTGTSPASGQASTFTGDSVTVTAPGGGSAPYNSITAGSAGAAGTGGHAGGTGGAGSATLGEGGGGGGSGGTAAAGNAGTASSGGGTGAAAVTGGGAGGPGGDSGGSGGHAGGGGTPGGGGGGGDAAFSPGGGNGGAGEVVLTYQGLGDLQTLVAHRPSFYAPPELVPFVQIPVADTPNGGTQYAMPSFTPGVNARFGGPYTGTYSVVVAPYSWSGGAASTTPRTITVTVTQYEQSGGQTYTASVSASYVLSGAPLSPSALPQLSVPHAGTGFVRLGEITLPPNILPADNTDCYFTVAITSTNTSDRFQDVLFLDTMGSTVIIESPVSYQNLFVDEPDVNQGYGNVMGTVFDRADAVSVLDRASISGGPLDVDPYGNRSLLVYCLEGNPNVEVTYFPRYFLERPVQ